MTIGALKKPGVTNPVTPVLTGKVTFFRFDPAWTIEGAKEDMWVGVVSPSESMLLSAVGGMIETRH